MSNPHALENQEDLFALLRTMPEQDRFRCLGIYSRMKNGKITVEQATEEVKQLLLKNGIYKEVEQ